jgi:DNA-binding transcriptional LysR family regulator
MELMQLAMFMAAVEERSIQRAADRVGRSQPAVSIALHNLEKELGMELLDRTTLRDYRPTQAGQLLYDCASKITVLLNEVVAVIRKQAEIRPGQSQAGVPDFEREG